MKRDRAIRRQALKAGDEFRPYDLFDTFSILPFEVLALKNLSPGAKLVWGLISKHLGKEGAAFPSMKTLGNELGTSSRQIIRWTKELKDRGLLRTITRGRNRSLEYRLLWHDDFRNDKSSPHCSDESSSSADNLSSPSSAESSSEKHHHRNSIEKANLEKSGYDAQVEPNKDYIYKPASALPNCHSHHDDDEEKQQQQIFKEPIEEFRARLKRRSWKVRPIELEGVAQMVRETLSNNSSRIRRFLEYEEPLTVPEKIKNVGGHYRTLLKNFLGGEPNDRIEEQRKKTPARQGQWDKWQCPDGNGCKKSIIEDENGIPLRIWSCAKHLPKEQLDRLRADVAALQTMSRSA